MKPNDSDRELAAIVRCDRRRRRPTPEEVDQLAHVVKELSDQVRMLRLAVDEIGEELGWAIGHRVIPHLAPPTLPPITSFPADPLADDFAERVNAVRRDAIAAIRQTLCIQTQTNLW